MLSFALLLKTATVKWTTLSITETENVSIDNLYQVPVDTRYWYGIIVEMPLYFVFWNVVVCNNYYYCCMFRPDLNRLLFYVCIIRTGGGLLSALFSEHQNNTNPTQLPFLKAPLLLCSKMG